VSVHQPGTPDAKPAPKKEVKPVEPTTVPKPDCPIVQA